MEPIPAGANPFNHDYYHMGTYVASNVAIMHATHDDQRATYVIVINRETGERVRVIMLDDVHGNGIAR